MFSVKRLSEYLGITLDEAKAVRAILDTKLVRGERASFEQDSPEYKVWHDKPSRKLYAINRAIKGNGFHGVEILRSTDDTMHEFLGVTYLNAGDTYAGTILYDHKRGKWLLSNWGTIVERFPRRFE